MNDDSYCRIFLYSLLYFQGAYISPGMNVKSICENSNFPKMFIYGTYKFHIIYYTRKNEIFGCQGFIFDMKRP